MSLYNLMNGVKPSAFFVLPLIGDGYHPEQFPRFRDCFLGDDERPELGECIIVYTRTGGGNRDDYEAENAWIRSLPGFITDYDDSFDCTFACWAFKVPDEWRGDLELFKALRLKEASPQYQERIRRVFPKLAEKLNELWGVPSAT